MFTVNTTRTIALSAILAAALSSTIANAQQTGERQGPPPEAIEICVDKAVETACTFTGKRGEVSGSCQHGPQGGGKLACAPEGRPPKGDTND